MLYFFFTRCPFFFFSKNLQFYLICKTFSAKKILLFFLYSNQFKNLNMYKKNPEKPECIYFGYEMKCKNLHPQI